MRRLERGATLLQLGKGLTERTAIAARESLVLVHVFNLETPLVSPGSPPPCIT